MRLLIALWFAFSSAALAQPQSDQRNLNFSLNQATQILQLDQKDFETIYRTDQVPDTCYRDEIQGTRTECQTVYDRQCTTRYEQQCYYRNYPVCQTVPRRVCHTTQQCRTEMDRVCNSHGCTTVPRRVCEPTQQCSTQMDQVCHTDQRYECQTVPTPYCQDVPRQVCSQVPNVVKVPYACTRPVQVPAGQQLKLHTVASVNVTLLNFSETGPLSDVLLATLDQGQVRITSQSPQMDQYLYQIVGEQRSEQIISSTEKSIQITLTMMATSISKLNELQSIQIQNGKLFGNRIEFSLTAPITVSLKGNLKLVQERRMRSDLVIVNDSFSSNALVGQPSKQTLMLNAFGVTELKSANHFVDLTLGLDLERLKKGLLNPLALSRVSDRNLTLSFQGTPGN